MLKLKDINKTYLVDKKRFPALKNINLTFPEKGFISILGPSGCGKTTLLNLIGGLDQYTSGDLIINNKSTKKFTDRDWDAYRNRRVGFVFQSYNLVSHLNVQDNVELSMTLTGMSKKERAKKAIAALTRVGLKKALKKKPNQLSGGQMQRVAIARSLVNNPEIILADEPTGALDSVTSVQVMELLKEVSKDRLVIMVTHNDELAEKYSTRIIRLNDGRVIKDSHPSKAKTKKDNDELQKEKNKHTHMSFFSALSSSARSLLTKKGRTAMTAVAASFGIIGVAIVLAMSNGFQGYVNRIEMETASSVPITISPYVTTEIKQVDLPEPWPDEEVIKPYSEDITQLMVLHRNRLTKDYAEYAKGLLKSPYQYASSVLENHEYLDFNIYTKQKGSDEVIKIDQFQSAGAGGAILSGVTNLPSTIFHELYGGADYINSLYDVVKGDPLVDQEIDPESPTCKLYLVCDRYNRIPIDTLKSLGLVPNSASEDKNISFDKILNHEYKSFTPSDVIKAAGVGAEITAEIPNTDYYVFSKDEKGDTFQAPSGSKTIIQYKNIGDNESDSQTARNDLYNNTSNLYKPVVMKIVGILRPKRNTLINLMPGSVCYPSALKKYYLQESYYKSYQKTARDNFYVTKEYIEQFDNVDGKVNEISDEDLRAAAEYFVLECISAYNSGNPSNLYSFLNDSKCFHFYGLFTEKFNQTAIDIAETPLRYGFSNKYLRSNYSVMQSFKDVKFIKNDDYSIYVPTGDYTFEDLATYTSGYSPITSILIFPKSLSDKQKVFDYLDRYNIGKEESQQILYSDIAGNLTTALGTMIDVISIVLICFSAVSLLVSCVMTGVITYTSVLERTKEIGILRAIGARKKDVGRLFEAESVIVGGVAGIAGVLFTFIVEWPISFIINNRFPEQHIGMICNLNPWHALLLVIISMLLTFISGFIPARKAAKKDPVVALRSE